MVPMKIRRRHDSTLYGRLRHDIPIKGQYTSRELIELAKQIQREINEQKRLKPNPERIRYIDSMSDDLRTVQRVAIDWNND